MMSARHLLAALALAACLAPDAWARRDRQDVDARLEFARQRCGGEAADALLLEFEADVPVGEAHPIARVTRLRKATTDSGQRLEISGEGRVRREALASIGGAPKESKVGIRVRPEGVSVGLPLKPACAGERLAVVKADATIVVPVVTETITAPLSELDAALDGRLRGTWLRVRRAYDNQLNLRWRGHRQAVHVSLSGPDGERLSGMTARPLLPRNLLILGLGGPIPPDAIITLTVHTELARIRVRIREEDVGLTAVKAR